MISYHKVRVNLTNEHSEDNKVFIDDKEIGNVREFAVKAWANKNLVTITFFADVEGEFGGAQEQEATDND